MPSSSTDCGSHLSLLNTLLAFRVKHPRFPSPLRTAGYDEDVLVEWEFGLAVGGRVSIDFICNNPNRDHALLLEVKGAVGDEEAQQRFLEQIARHAQITPDDVRGSAITLGEGETSFGLAVTIREEWVDEISNELDADDSHALVVLSITRDEGLCSLSGCHVARRELGDPVLEEALDFDLAPPLPIPDHFIPFDLNTGLLEVVAEILPVISGFYFDPSRSGFTQQEIAEATIPAWDLLQAAHQTGLATRVRRALRGLSSALGESGFDWDNNERQWAFRQPGDERSSGNPPTLNRPAFQALAREWDIEIEQLDVFLPPEAP